MAGSVEAFDAKLKEELDALGVSVRIDGVAAGKAISENKVSDPASVPSCPDWERLAYYRSHGLDRCDDYPGGDAAFEMDVLSGLYHCHGFPGGSPGREDAYVLARMADGRFRFDGGFIKYCRSAAMIEAFYARANEPGSGIGLTYSWFSWKRDRDEPKVELVRNGKPVTCREARTMLEIAFLQQFADVKARAGCDARLVYGDERDAHDLGQHGGVVVTTESPSDRFGLSGAYVAMPDCFPSATATDWPGADDPVDARDFVAVLIGIMHERAHVDQADMVRTPDGALAKVMAMNGFACHGNPSYYRKNYYMQPAEIAADYVAVCKTRAAMGAIGGISPEEADRYVLDYQEWRNAGWKDFAEPPKSGRFASVDDLEAELGNRFMASIHKKRTYDQTAFYALKDSASQQLAGDPVLAAKLSAERDGFEQDRIMASLYLERAAERFGGKEGKAEVLDRMLEGLKFGLGMDMDRASVKKKPFLDRLFGKAPKKGDPAYLAEQAFGELVEMAHEGASDDEYDGR